MLPHAPLSDRLTGEWKHRGIRILSFLIINIMSNLCDLVVVEFRPFVLTVSFGILDAHGMV